MIIKDGEYADIQTPTGPMRLHLFRPVAAGRYPGILLYSEIYQITGPIRRMAAFLAGQGYLVAAPEVYHEFEKPTHASHALLTKIIAEKKAALWINHDLPTFESLKHSPEFYD
jgi:dienelactone hydrolase